MNTLTSIQQPKSYRNQPRRRYSKQAKLEMVEALLTSSASLAQFARAHDVHYNLLSKWRREYFAGRLGARPGQIGSSAESSSLIPVTVSQPIAQHSILQADHNAVPANMPLVEMPDTPQPSLRIVLARGELVIEGPYSQATLRTVIEALQ